LLSLATLVGCQPTSDPAPNTACDIDYAAIQATEMLDIEEGRAVYVRFVTEDLVEDDLNPDEIASLDQWQAILDSHSRTVDRQDLAILESARLRLSDPSVWDRADDRKCEPQDETYSLFCALYFGSIDTIGEYQHRRTVMQEIRFAIEDVTVGQEFEHRLMDFNNLPETSFDSVMNVIQIAQDRVQERLELQAACAPQQPEPAE
jgi:hypothetical protein